ncbi:oxidoreductase [Bifidobacterium dolichotidis]|uniref:Oxidoreductase n=1 Tax=Bifidobacterium dolichotidis TaxID=2306976 RepID=A0A430FRU6_9BIFI|nr:Gfo/Idh/MocA family oxidoreductase [Bifidobacterium dolichotidis]RSX55589.1 oxidoreductase [Bifidobacterium dolichotidis]
MTLPHDDVNFGRMNGKGQGTINVAILGAGRIAQSMAKTLQLMAQDDRYSSLVAPYAVASRSMDRAQSLADQYGFARAYGSYDELLADPLVDLVYIATPHSLHMEQAIACMRAGKNVLVEKSFTANAEQAQKILDVADDTGLLCTEAIWTRYMPSRLIIDQIVSSGVLGDVTTISADLSYTTSYKARLTDPALAGGALLDVGVYTLNFIDMIMGAQEIDRMVTSMLPYETGVDASNSTTLYYPDGTMAVATSSMMCQSDRDGRILGTKGYAIVHNINNPEAIDVFGDDHDLQRHLHMPDQLTGYEYEVEAAARAILAGNKECLEMTHADTLRMMSLMDQMRASWHMQFPFEK